MNRAMTKMLTHTRMISSKNMEDKIISLSCHPGWADTNLPNTSTGKLGKYLKNNRQKGQSAADGSLPLLMAAVGKNVENGDYLGRRTA
jgi:hypothetical protein